VQGALDETLLPRSGLLARNNFPLARDPLVRSRSQRERRHDQFPRAIDGSASGAKALEDYVPVLQSSLHDRQTGRPDAGGLLACDMLACCNVPTEQECYEQSDAVLGVK
jgi:hypothetical protein